MYKKKRHFLLINYQSYTLIIALFHRVVNSKSCSAACG